ncbi:mycothione reductase, partial [Arthrobacter deserti]|nr:mycothione reductase [Arthrobacter deserti]
MTYYGLAIVGSGSGNSLGTPYWDNKKVAIIVGGTFGGTCLNAGCIPTKMFVYPSTLAAAAGQAEPLG